MAPTHAASSTPSIAVGEFAALLDRCQLPVYTFLRRLVGDEEAARDLMQDTFCAAWQVAQRGVPPFNASVETYGVRRWLFHAAYNRAISSLRCRRLIAWHPLDDVTRDVPADSAMAFTFEDRSSRRRRCARRSRRSTRRRSPCCS
jgi:DNA-directed RNA polymerase specialized sigma24 family protein